MVAYKRAAPQLLHELARLLSQHKWGEKGRVPHGIVNILNCSWQDLTAGASIQEQSGKEKSHIVLKLHEAQVSPDGEREAGRRNSCVVEDVVRGPQAGAKPRVKKRKHRGNIKPWVTLLWKPISARKDNNFNGKLKWLKNTHGMSKV